MQSGFALVSGIWRPLTALILASIVIMGSPGPSTISVTAMGAAFGVRRSLRYACGLILGTIAVLFLVAAGIVALLVAIPYAAQVLGAVSVAYILYLALRIATAPPLGRNTENRAAPVFGGGFLLAIANPKAYLAIAAVYAGTTVIAADQGLDAIIKTVLLSLMIVIIHLFWLLTGASLSRILHDPVSSRVVNVTLAAALVIMTLAAFLG
jgi:threonine/homoserine/homoserine lactone efflux protein